MSEYKNQVTDTEQLSWLLQSFKFINKQQGGVEFYDKERQLLCSTESIPYRWRLIDVLSSADNTNKLNCLKFISTLYNDTMSFWILEDIGLLRYKNVNTYLLSVEEKNLSTWDICIIYEKSYIKNNRYYCTNTHFLTYLWNWKYLSKYWTLWVYISTLRELKEIYPKSRYIGKFNQFLK
jgi:hypothetical protein